MIERKRSATWQVAIAVLGVTVGAAALGYLAVQLLFLPETVAESRLNRVPDLTGKDVEDALKAGETAGYMVIESGGQFSDDVDVGDVLYQIPPPGSYLQRGDTLWVLRSLGESEPMIPDLAGVEPAIARSVLAGLGVETTASRRAASDLHPQGMVMETIPPGGTPIEEDTRVTLVISRGGSFLEMPDVTDLPLASARDSLESFGLTVGEVTGVEEDQATGEAVVVVVSQEPAAYRRVRAGSAVRLRLGEKSRAEVRTPADEAVSTPPEEPAETPAEERARPPQDRERPADDDEVTEQPDPAERRRQDEEQRRPDETEEQPAERPPAEEREAQPLPAPDEPADAPAPADTTP